MTDIRLAEDAFLEAKAEFDEFAAEFISDWYRPYMEQAAMITWVGLPPEVKAEIIKRVPDAAAKIQEIADRYAAGIKDQPK